jgi:ribonuclease G
MRISCPYCEGRGRVLSPETMALRLRRDLRRSLRQAKGGAVLVEVHPDVEAALREDGDGWMRQLEDSSGRRLRIRGRDGMHLERLRLVEASTVEGLEEAARKGEGEQMVWVDHEPSDTVPVAEPDEDQEVALAASVTQSNGLLARLRRLLGGV